MGHLVTPKGTKIVATLEQIPGTCPISFVELDDNGEFEITYGGETDIDWDNQSTVSLEGQDVFIDEEGAYWLESQLTLQP